MRNGWKCGGKMKVQFTNRTIVLKHKLKKEESYKVNKEKNFFSIVIYKKPTIITGITNATEDHRYIGFFDYDSVALDLVKEDVKILQKKYHLPKFYLFTTKKESKNGIIIGNFHLINLRKFPYDKIRKIINDSRCDWKYKSMCDRSYWKSWVLRISNKEKRQRPKFIGILGNNKNLNYQISSPHLKMLQKIYPNIPHINYSNKDKLKKVFMQQYETLNF